MTSISTNQITKMISAFFCLLASCVIFRRRVRSYELDPVALLAALKNKEGKK